MLDGFAFRLTQYMNCPVELRAVCKRCLLSVNGIRDTFQLWDWCLHHDCKQVKVANFSTLPNNLPEVK